MDLKDIDYMLAIAEHGSILRAAGHLHITQSALSKYVQSMEKRLGYSLFERTKKNQLTLSPEGELYIHYAKRIDNERRLYFSEIENLHKKELRIRVGIGLAITRVHLTQIMEDFKNVYPACNVYICSQWMRQNISAVLDGTLDFAFAYMVDEEYRSLLHFIPIFDDEIMVAIPASHPSVKEIRTNPKTGLPWIDIHLLENEPFILQNEQCHVRGPIDHLFADLDFKPLVHLTTNSTSASVSMAERGLGIAVCTYTLSEEHPNVCFATIDDLSHSIPNGLIMRRDKILSIYANYFISLFRKYNGNHKYENQKDLPK